MSWPLIFELAGWLPCLLYGLNLALKSHGLVFGRPLILVLMIMAEWLQMLRHKGIPKWLSRKFEADTFASYGCLRQIRELFEDLVANGCFSIYLVSAFFIPSSLFWSIEFESWGLVRLYFKSLKISFCNWLLDTLRTWDEIIEPRSGFGVQ